MKKKQSSLSIQISGESDLYLRFRCFLSAFFGVLYWILYWKNNVFPDQTIVTENQIQEAFIWKGLLFGRFFQMGEETGALWLCGIAIILILFLLLAILSRKKIIFLGFMGGMTVLIALRTGWVPGTTGILCLAFCLLTLFVPSFKGTILLSVPLVLLFFLCFWGKTDFLNNRKGFQDIWEQWKYNSNLEILPEGKLENAQGMKRGEEEVLSIRMTYPCVYYLRGFTGTVFENNTWSDGMQSLSVYEPETEEDEETSSGRKYEELTHNTLQIRNTGANRRFLYLPYECITRFAELEQNGKAVCSEGENLYATGWTGAKVYQCTAYETLSKGMGIQEEVSADCLMLTREEKQIIAELLGKKKANEEVSPLSVLGVIKEWMGEHLQYDEMPGEIPEGESFASWFLEKERKGYDVQYATAAVMFFRYYGIPARYVEGYLLTPEDLSEGNSDGGFSVKEKDAHAWAEIYQKETGWIPVEVLEAYEDKMGISYLEQLDNPAVTQSSKGEVEEKQEEISDKMESSSEEKSEQNMQAESEKASEDNSSSNDTYNNDTYNIEETHSFSKAGRIVILLLVLFLGFAGGRKWLRRRRRIQEEKRWKASGNYGFCVDMYYRKLCSLLSRCREDGEEVEECLQRIDRKLDKKELEYCMQIREKVLFSNTLITIEQRDRACDFLEKEWKRIYALLPWRSRWRLVLK